MDNAEDIYIVAPMYNLLEYDNNYSMTSGSLRNYYRDKVKDSANENTDANSYIVNNNNIATSKSFGYKTKIIGSIPTNNSKVNAEIVVPVKYLSKFGDLSICFSLTTKEKLI